MQIQNTTNYTQFIQVKSNREVNAKHVIELADSIENKNLLAYNPIIVNEAMEVIDGQHRLEAAKMLKVPIYYVVADGVKENDIASLNTNQRNWSVMDYINHYMVNGNENFRTLHKFMRKHNLKWSTALTLLHSDERLFRLKDEIAKGVCNVKNLKNAEKLIVDLKEIEVYGSWIFAGRFLSAVRVLVAEGHWDIEKLKKSLQKDASTFKEWGKVPQIMDMLLPLMGFPVKKPEVKKTKK